MIYTRSTDTEHDPLFALVVAKNEAGSIATFQLQPERPLTKLEADAISQKGENPADFIWVGYPVKFGSDPVAWSREIVAKVVDAKRTLADAADLSGELINNPDDPFAEMFGTPEPFQAIHFLRRDSAATEEEAEQKADLEMGRSSFGLWLRAGDGKPAREKYSY